MAGVGANGGYQPWSPGNPTPPGPDAWPAGMTWPLRASKQVYAADLNQQLSLPVTFLSRKPMFQGQQATSQEIPVSTSTPVTLDTEISDGWYMHNSDADTSQVGIPLNCGGVWLVQGSIPFGASVSGYAYEADIMVGGSVYSKGERWESTGAHVTPGVADLIKLNDLNYVQLAGWQSSPNQVLTFCSDSAPYSSAGFPQLTMRWVAGAYGTVGLAPPNPGTWTANQTVTSAQMNSDIRDSVRFLSYVPHCRVDQATGQSIPTGTLTTITGWNTPTLDNYSAWSGSTWTCPVAGVWLLCAQVAFGQQAAAYSASTGLNVTHGTSTTYYGSKARGTNIASMVLRTFRLSAGDTAQVQGFHNATGSSTTQTGANTRFFALWMSK